MTAEPIPAALRPGAKSSWSRVVTDADIERFAEISGDRGRHHIERDEKGRLLAHGLLTATMATKLGGDLHYLARTMEFDFARPVYGGDRLTCEGTVVSSVAQSSRIKARIAFEVRNQDGIVVLSGTTTGQVAR